MLHHYLYVYLYIYICIYIFICLFIRWQKPASKVNALLGLPKVRALAGWSEDLQAWEVVGDSRTSVSSNQPTQVFFTVQLQVYNSTTAPFLGRGRQEAARLLQLHVWLQQTHCGRNRAQDTNCTTPSHISWYDNLSPSKAQAKRVWTRGSICNRKMLRLVPDEPFSCGQFLSCCITLLCTDAQEICTTFYVSC